MKDNNLDTLFENMQGRIIHLRKLNNIETPINVSFDEELATLDKSLVKAKSYISGLDQPMSLLRYLAVVLVSMITGVFIFLFIISMIPSSPTMSDFEPRGITMGDIGVTSKEYIYKFNESFIGYIVDVNKTNRSNTALITLQNGDKQIILNEYWVQYPTDYWFEETYNVDNSRHINHFDDYNGSYLFTDGYDDPISRDWEIIYTIDGKIVSEYYSPKNEHRFYYYNNTLIGGVVVEYVDNKFIILSSKEEIEYQIIL